MWLPPKDGEFEVPIGGKVVHHDGSRVKILDDEGGVRFVLLSFFFVHSYQFSNATCFLNTFLTSNESVEQNKGFN